MTPFIRHICSVCILLAVISSVLSGCSASRHIEDDETLLRETKIQNPPSNHGASLRNVISQKPNSKVLGIFPLRMWIYSGLKKEEARRFRSWLTENLGEPPVVMDSAKMKNSAEAMENYLFNKGYFDAEVEPEFIIRGINTTVIFHIRTGEPYRISELSYHSMDEKVDSFINANLENQEISVGMIYDSDKLNSERVRLESLLRNNGYYNFRRDYIYYDIDSSKGNRKVNIGTGIQPPDRQIKHRQYTIDKIYVDPLFEVEANSDTIEHGNIHFLKENSPIRHENLARLIYFQPGEIYSQEKTRQTLRRLNAFGVFQYIDITFSETPEDSSKLTAHINLRPAPKQEFALESELLTRERSEEGLNVFSPERFYGIGTNLRYRHKNVARRGLQIEANTGGLWEVQWHDWLTNYQLRGGGSIRFPGLLVPGSIFDRIRENPTNTSINMNYIFENNQNFRRHSGNISLQYQIERGSFSHFISPFQASLVSTFARPEFESRLNDWLGNIEDPFIRDFYNNLYGSRHLIQGMRYSIMYNTAGIDPDENYWFLRYTVLETSGNMLALINRVIGEDAPASPRDEFFGIDYYQYVKSDFDLRYNHMLERDRSLVYRLNVGAGLPYGNSDFMPFEKRFFTGGTNSIRAWRVRTLGPGSAQAEDAFIDRTGDFKLEMNTEFRFPISGILEGAVFIDGGNVWKWEDQEIPGSDFRSDEFLNEIAIGTGIGLRLDFSFFIFRLDLGLRARDPSLENDPWVFRNITERSYWETIEGGIENENNYNINFGIGYPF